MKFRAAILATACTSFGSAQAATVEGLFFGTIAAPAGATSNIEFAGAGTNQLVWGTPTPAVEVPTVEASSSLTVNDDNFIGDASSTDPILLGTITWINKSNWNTGSSWDSSLDLSILFTAPSNSGPFSEIVTFSLTNTSDPSFNTDNNETNGENPDRVTEFGLETDAFDVPLNLGGSVTLDSIKIGIFDAGDAGEQLFDKNGHPIGDVCAFGPHDNKGSFYSSNENKWKNCEGNASTIGIYGHFSHVPAVPLPAGGWLLIGGLATLATARRRKS